MQYLLSFPNRKEVKYLISDMNQVYRDLALQVFPNATIVIDKIYTIHYFEYSKDYRFVGERHDFWEFVYVDKGEIIATAEDEDFLLDHGKVIFHKPNQWHTLRANGSIAPNIVIVSFSCKGEAMNFFEDKIMAVGQAQKSLISKIIVKDGGLFFKTALYGCTGKLICESDHLEPLKDLNILLEIWETIW